jgi:hypothetical protein
MIWYYLNTFSLELAALAQALKSPEQPEHPATTYYSYIQLQQLWQQLPQTGLGTGKSNTTWADDLANGRILRHQ